jgi:hypothetical protein
MTGICSNRRKQGEQRNKQPTNATQRKNVIEKIHARTNKDNLNSGHCEGQIFVLPWVTAVLSILVWFLLPQRGFKWRRARMTPQEEQVLDDKKRKHEHASP